jgi:hypothetical protein
MQLKQKYSIKKSLLRLLPFVMLMAPACKKKKVEPTLPEPEHYNVVIDWNWDDGLGLAPPMDTVKKYTSNRYIDTVFINLTSPNSTGLLTKHFRKARDTLQTRIDLAPQKVWGKGGVYVNSTNGAQLPGYDEPVCGMALVDSIWFTDHGWTVKRLGQKYK